MGLLASLAGLTVEGLGALLSPPRCAACDARVFGRAAFCGGCAASLLRADLDPTAATRSAFVYGGALARAITAFKYEPRPDLARPLGHLLRRALAPLVAAPPDVVVPVPLHAARLAERGFNHAALLAVPVARDLGARFAPCALARVRATDAQATLDRSERLANVQGAFAARDRSLRGARVLLIDDVRTTGATLDACAAALDAAGAHDVRALTLAQTDDALGGDRAHTSRDPRGAHTSAVAESGPGRSVAGYST